MFGFGTFGYHFKIRNSYSGGVAAAKQQMHGIHYPFHIKISTGFLAIPDTTPRHCCSLHCIRSNREKPIPCVLTQTIKSLQISLRFNARSFLVFDNTFTIQ